MKVRRAIEKASLRVAEDPLCDFRNFAWHIFTGVLGLETPHSFQYDIAEWMASPTWGPDGIGRNQTQALRGTGKTILMSALVCWLWYLDPTIRCLIISSNQLKATEISNLVKQILERSPFLQHLVPDQQALGGLSAGKARLKRDKNTEQSWDIAGAGPGKDPSLACYPIFGGFTGSHPDFLGIDDIEIPENSGTPTKRARLLAKTHEFESLIMEGGYILIDGTPQTRESIYTELAKTGYPLRRYPAEAPALGTPAAEHVAPYILDKVRSGEWKPGDVTYPERFPAERLEEKKIKNLAYYRLQFLLDTSMVDALRHPLKIRNLMLLDPAADLGPGRIAWGTTSPVHHIDLAGFPGDVLYRPAYVDQQFHPWDDGVLWCDPAGGGGDSVAYAVVKILNGILYLCEVGELAAGVGSLGTSDEVLEAVAEAAKRWDIRRICVESNWGGSKNDSAWARLLGPVVARICGPVAIEPKWSLGQKEVRICGILEPLLNSHRLAISEQAANCESFIYQLSHITRDKNALIHDDVIEAVAMACNEFVSRIQIDPVKAVSDEARAHLKAEVEEFLKHVPQAAAAQAPRASSLATIKKRTGRRYR